MSQKRGDKSKILRDLILKFPKTSKRGLAQLAVEKYPLLFTAESARTSIRDLTGSNGKERRSQVTDVIEKPVYELPPSKCQEREFKVLPKNANNILWLSDLHIPNQDNDALKAAIDFGEKEQVNCIVLGGDVMDNTPFSQHDGPPPGLNDVREWFEYTEQFLAYLRNRFSKATIIWLECNHDNWMMRFLMKKAPILFSDEYYHLPQRLNLKKYRIEFYPEHIILMAGKLQMHHGHTMIRGVFAPVNAARGLFLRIKSNGIIGHVHTTSQHSEKNLKGDIMGTWSVGCLCTLSPNYDPHNTKHNQGFAIIKVKKDENFEVNNYSIHKGVIL